LKTFAANETGHRTGSAQASGGAPRATYRRTHAMPPRLEEITYDLSRTALADQSALVSGIRSRAATLVAAQALVASFLGDTAADGGSFDAWGWAAVVALTLGLLLATLIVAPWRISFALDARLLHRRLRAQAVAESEAGTLGWLTMAALQHHHLHDRNLALVRRLNRLSAASATLTIVQSLLWIISIGVR
jgi:hypothetical protein